jgi:hypothetical protein
MRASSLHLQQRPQSGLSDPQTSQRLAKVLLRLSEGGNASGVVAGLAPAGE